MISIIITSYKEPRTISKAIESFLNQNIEEKYELIISAPDKETLDVAKKYSKKFKQIKLFKDKGRGKASAINQVLKILKGRIIILTDGDVYVSKNSVNHLINAFKDKKIACATGRPVSIESKNKILGYWSHMLCDAGAHRLRIKMQKQGKFLECSGYLWAFRKNLIKTFPVDVAEDSIVPLILWMRGYKTRYVPEAEVYVSYPKNFNDFIEQKKRTIKSHEKLYRYIKLKKIPRMKSIKNEIFGIWDIITYAPNFKTLIYTFLAFPVRLLVWILAYSQYIFKREYSDRWKRVESTK